MPYMLRYPPGYDLVLDTAPVWIGNDSTDNIIVYDLATLPHQAIIEPNVQGYGITNRGTFGFLVNGYELAPGSSFQLEPGSDIRIGQAVITYFWQDDELDYEPASSNSSGGWVFLLLVVIVVIGVAIFWFASHP